ncbi:MAG: hypothetical protein KDK34_15800, partial [Leptospiraceae bacterium]|nr:hypothetical protein [Leptospiraceae bacterium]
MSLPFLIAAILNTVLATGLTVYLRARYRSALTSVVEKSAGPVYFYQQTLARFLKGDWQPVGALIFFHYISLHGLVPLWGFGLFLHADINFLVVILWIICALQLIQRL